MIKEKLIDIPSETAVVGLIYGDESLLEEYADKINYNNDFADPVTKFFYYILLKTFGSQGKISDSAISIYISRQNKDVKAKFKEYGGLETLERFKNVANSATDGIENAYRSLKNYYLFRKLDDIHIDVRPFIEQMKDEDGDYVINMYEKYLDDLATHVRGINSPENIGNKAKEHIERLKLKPDVGITIPFPIVSGMIRGLKKGSLIALGAHTNRGKSRFVSKIWRYISMDKDYKSLLISTEMTADEMRLQLFTDIANSEFLSDENKIEERDIAAQNLTAIQEEALIKSAEYLETYCHGDFICTNTYDIKTLERMIKRAVILGTEYIFIDVLKPMRGESIKSDMAEWQRYTMTAERLKQLAIKLDICIVITTQLKSGTEDVKDLSYSHISIGSHIAHVLDVCLLFRDLSRDEIDQDKYQDVETGQVFPLESNKKYMTCKIAKNRQGEVGEQIVMEVRKGYMEFEEKGYLVSGFKDVIK